METSAVLPSMPEFEALIAALRGGAREAETRLGLLGAGAAPALCGLLRDPEWLVRWSAARVLGRLGDPETAPALWDAAHDAVPAVRERATEALARLAAPERVDDLVAMLRDPLPAVRRRAVSALIRLGPIAVEPLLHALGSREAEVRGLAALALGRILDAHAPPLASLVLSDPDAWVRATAAAALSCRPGAGAAAILQQALLDGAETVRVAAAEALAELAERGCAAHAGNALPELRKLAAEAEAAMATYWAAARYRSAVFRVESACAKTAPGRRSRLPVPAFPREPATGQLPLVETAPAGWRSGHGRAASPRWGQTWRGILRLAGGRCRDRR